MVTNSTGRTFFEAFVAILAAVALVLGFYVFGHAMNDDDGSSPAAAVEDPPTETGATALAADTAADDGATDEGHGHGTGVDDRGFAALENGEQHDEHFTQPMTAEERVELGRQLALAREVALQWPTLADAEAAGMWRAGPFAPGLGTHMINTGAALGNADGVMDDDDIRSPLAVMYDGVEPTSRVAGLFYGATSADYPEGFAGPNDTWHIHSSICIVSREGGGIDTPLGADRDVSKEQCDAVGGNLLEQTQWLLHVWVVPGFESDQGVFAHLSSAITCANGTYHMIPDVTKVGTRSSVCADAA